MIAPAQTLAGSITADGALVLDANPSLPPGRVTVTVAPVIVEEQCDLIKMLEAMDARRRAMSLVARTSEEIEAAIAEARESDTHDFDRWVANQ